MKDRPGAPGEAVPRILDVPVGVDAVGTRRETDSLGAIQVPAGHYWGAQTQRSLEHFAIGRDRMPVEVFHAYGHLKKAAALVNSAAGRLPGWMGELIARVCDEVVSGALDAEFPLSVWQAGSGTHTNMNVNEVVSNRCIQLLGGDMGSKTPVHPNDHVNMAQSSNDTFPTAMHIAAYATTTRATLPALRRLQAAVGENSRRWQHVVKLGRTHLEDATPLTVGQEWSGYAAGLEGAIAEVEHAVAGLLPVAMGGTAVGTGLNAPPGFAEQVAATLARLTGDAYVTAPNMSAAQATLDPIVRAHGALKSAAVTLYKIADDMRWLGSGPRAGLHELVLPANEPGSSMMPGKVNPTQAEVLLMVCLRVVGADTTVAMAGAEGNFELNAFRPIVIGEYLNSAMTLGDACDCFRELLVEGVELDERRIAAGVSRSLMMVTVLAPVIGYDRAADIAHYAVEHDLALRDAAFAKGVDQTLFDRLVVPESMVGLGGDESDGASHTGEGA